MKHFSFYISFLFLATLATAAENSGLVIGGESPNGKYVAKIVWKTKIDPNSHSGYTIQIYKKDTAKPFYTLDDLCGYLSHKTALKRCRAMWHKSGDFVVITNQGSRHSKEIYIIALEGNAQLLEVPDYVQNALGRVGATEIDLHCISTPISWNDNALHLTLYFSARIQKQGRLFYTSEITLYLVHGRDTAPSIQIKSVSVPKNPSYN